MSANPNLPGKPPVTAQYGSGGGMIEQNRDAKQWAMFAHLSPPILLLLGVSAIGLGFIGPLIIWLMKKDDYPFVDDQGREAINFSITMMILYAIAWAASIVTCGALILLTILALFVVAIIQIFFGIIGGIKAAGGEYYRYPICIRLI